MSTAEVLRRKLRRDVRARRPQFLALAFTVFLGVTLFGASLDAYRNLVQSYDHMFEVTRFGDYWIVGGDTDAIASALEDVEGVDAVSVRTQTDVPVRVGADHRLLGRIVGMPEGRQPSVNGVLIVEGEYLPEDSGSVALAEEHMWEHFDLSVDDTVQVYGPSGWSPLEVIGEAATAEYLWPARNRQDVLTDPDDFGVLFVPESLVREVAPAAPRQVSARYSDRADVDAVDARLREIALEFGALDFVTRAEQPSNAALSEDIQGFSQMACTFPILFLGAAGLAMYVLLTRLVRAQQTTIGMMLANGMPQHRVYTHYLGYGLVIGVGGALPGVVAGYLLGRVVSELYTGAIDIPVTVIGVHPWTLAIGILFGSTAGFLAATAPARAASRMEPALAMRGDLPQGVGRVSIAERLLPVLRRAPATWHMVVRNIERNPRRTAYTIIGVVLSLVLILASSGMVDTIDSLLAKQEHVKKEDATVMFDSPVTASQLGELAAIDGVKRVEPVTVAEIALAHGDERYDTVLEAYSVDTQMHEFLTPEGGTIALPARGALAGKALRETLGVAVGDVIGVHLPLSGTPATVEIAGFVDEPLGTYLYMSLDQLAVLTGHTAGTPVANTAALELVPGTDANEIRELSQSVPGVVAYTSTQQLLKTLRQYMGLFRVFVGVMLVLGAALACALIFTAMSVNIGERVGEFASLEAEGFGRRNLAVLVTWENLLIVGLGILPGLLAGYVLARAFMASYSSDLFSLDLAMQPQTFVLAAVAVVVAALVSQWPGLRALGRIDIASVVRERAQ